MEFNYLVEKRRMLDSLGRTGDKCNGVKCPMCPLSNYNNGSTLICGVFEIQHPIEATAVVRKWAEEHPKRTRKDVLLEKFPNAMLMKDGTPYSCCEALGIAVKTECEEKRCSDCWNKEVEE